MNYYIDNHDKNIILDALENLHQEMFSMEQSGEDISDIYCYTLDDVDRIFKSLLDIGEQTWDMK